VLCLFSQMLPFGEQGRRQRRRAARVRATRARVRWRVLRGAP